MKKYGTFIALGIALLFGMGAVFLANKWMSSKVPGEKVVFKESVPLTKIVITSKDLEAGSPLKAENLTLADWPKASAPKGAFANISDVEGRVTLTKMMAGKPVLNAELADPGSGIGLVALIEPGKRAMAIKVDEVIGVGGFILPHTFVDVIAVEAKKKDVKPKAKTILKKIEVLAIAQQTYTEDGKAKLVRTVTLQLEPKQAETLAMHTNKDPIHLVLRNPLDDEQPKPEVKKVVKKKVARRQPVVALQPRVYVPKPSPHAVEVIRGAKTQKYEFKNVNSEERL